MSTEEQNKPESSESAECHSVPGNLGSNQEQAEPQTTHSGSEKRTFLYRCREILDNYRLWQFLKDPKMWFETAALIVVICYTRYAGQQSRTMSNTLVEIRQQTEYAKESAHAATDAATAAQKALDMTRDNFRQDQRPYIWVTSLGEPTFVPQAGQIIWTWHMTNYGRSPAYRLRVRQFGKVGNLLVPQFQARPANFSGDIGAPLPPTGDQFNTVVFPPKMTQEQFNKLFASDNGIGIRVQITYTDSYGGSYETSFCYSHLASGASNYCREYNYIK